MVKNPIMLMQGEDAPQITNSVDLDPKIKDLNGRPAPRITYKNHAFELMARKFYVPKMRQIMKKAGAISTIEAPMESIATTRHIMGTLRFGTSSAESVCNANGKFHDIGNLLCVDGSLFPTSSGYNPTLTIAALASRCAAALVYPENPDKAL